MTWSIRFTPLAAGDIAEAYAWYQQARQDLGEDFLEELGRVIGLISTFPASCPMVHRDLRRALLSRFPYSLYYRLVEASAEIEVRACVHQRRPPQSWQQRA